MPIRLVDISEYKAITKFYPQGDDDCQLYLPLYDHALRGSEAIVSKDQNLHVCTVTGAVWRVIGRDFDGLDDKIDVSDESSFDFETTSPFSIVIWSKRDATGDKGLWHKMNWTSNKGYFLGDYTNKIYFQLQSDVTYKFKKSTSTIANGVWFHAGGTYDGSATLAGIKVYLNGIDDSDAGAEVGTLGSLLNDVTPAIGWRGDAETYFNGLIGEVFIYSRALTALEIRDNYLATKWRYS